MHIHSLFYLWVVAIYEHGSFQSFFTTNNLALTYSGVRCYLTISFTQRRRIEGKIVKDQQDNKLKNYMEVERFRIQERLCLRHLAISTIVFIRRLWRSRETQPGSLTGSAGPGPLVRASHILLPCHRHTDYFDPFANRYLPRRTAHREAGVSCGCTTTYPIQLNPFGFSPSSKSWILESSVACLTTELRRKLSLDVLLMMSNERCSDTDDFCISSAPIGHVSEFCYSSDPTDAV